MGKDKGASASGASKAQQPSLAAFFMQRKQQQQAAQQPPKETEMKQPPALEQEEEGKTSGQQTHPAELFKAKEQALCDGPAKGAYECVEMYVY